MTGTRSEAAWSAFWQAGGAGPESGCLPNALRQIDAVQREVWTAAVQKLPRNARVLDLATGDGAVLGKIRRVRPDLKLMGVDSAKRLPPAPKGVHLRAGVPMERLPFPNGHFELITSQFGFEYGDVPAISAEVARVLRPGGRFQFMVHHAGGPIVGHNEKRRAGLAWALQESGVLQRARALVHSRMYAPIPTPPSFRATAAEARRLFPGQPVAEEFCLAILQTLELGRTSPPAESAEVLHTLESRASNELQRVDALRGAACGPEEITQIVQHLRAAGLEPEEPGLLRETGSHKPFAWLVSGARGQSETSSY